MSAGKSSAATEQAGPRLDKNAGKVSAAESLVVVKDLHVVNGDPAALARDMIFMRKDYEQRGR